MSSAQSKAHILVVDDDRTSQMMLTQMLSDNGYEFTKASNGKEAVAIISEQKTPFNAILLDQEMPEMNGMEVLEWLRSNQKLAKSPVIFQSGNDRLDNLKKAYDAGAFIYLPKPLNQNALISAINRVSQTGYGSLSTDEMIANYHECLGLTDKANYTIRTLEQACKLAHYLSHAFKNPAQSYPGIRDLLINAIEHGNLAISHDEHMKLLEDDRWEDEIKTRLEHANFKNKDVSVHFSQNAEATMIKIKDQGHGFDWKPYMQPLEGSLSDKAPGTGIIKARFTSFDFIRYNPAGNEVIATVLNTRNE